MQSVITGNNDIAARNEKRRFSKNCEKSVLDSEDIHCLQCPYKKNELKHKPFRIARQKIHMFTEDPSSSVAAKIWSMFIMGLIFVSTLSFVLESVRSLSTWGGFFTLEAVITIIFTAEYVIRLLTCQHMMKFVVAPLNLIDLIAIVPFYIELIAGGGGGQDVLRVIRVIRLARVFRLFRSPRLREFVDVLAETFRRASDSFVFIGSMVGLAIIVFSSLIFFAERGSLDEITGEYYRAGEDSPSPYSSIVATFYWCAVTMTTVGYGDIYPITPLGKIIASITMVCSTLILAFPIIIIGSHFEQVYSEFREKDVARRQASSEKADSLLVYLQKHRSELVKHIAGISQYFMLLENPTEADAVIFRDAVCALGDVFDQFDHAKSLSESESASRAERPVGRQISQPELLTYTPSSFSKPEADIEHGAAGAHKLSESN